MVETIVVIGKHLNYYLLPFSLIPNIIYVYCHYSSAKTGRCMVHWAKGGGVWCTGQKGEVYGTLGKRGRCMVHWAKGGGVWCTGQKGDALFKQDPKQIIHIFNQNVTPMFVFKIFPSYHRHEKSLRMIFTGIYKPTFTGLT